MTQPKKHFPFYLALLSIVGFLATDMYLPAFDIMHRDLATSKALIGASLTLFLGGYAAGQLLWGPLSDRYGKPEAILAGLSIFTLSSILLFFTVNIYIFLTLRLMQALGACSAAVCWQALVIDRYPADKVKKVFASIMPLVALSPALSPLLGVWILNALGWQFIFLILAVVGGVLIFYSFGLVGAQRQLAGGGGHTISYLTFFRSSKYMGNVMLYGMCSAGFFAWLTGAPFFLKELGYSERQIGLSFVPQTIAFMSGGYGYRLISGRVDGRKVLPVLLIAYSLSMLTILWLGLFTVPTLTALLIPFSMMAFANGAGYPIMVAEALQPFANHSGKASALQNALQLGMCFVASAAVSAFSNHALMATCIIMASTVIFVVWGYALSRK